ncbi:polyphenol oxidase family protein [Collinsella provencensis]|uniref:polyphenol oxidase family protein n=1 Tax=Collinsella provencensis TaxID=1937461 RepID=UPI000C8248C7|nr:polyphenol oxidase family protein [Collinsella provencensis]
MERIESNGVALTGVFPNAQGSSVAFGFTERTGGVSVAPYTSLNLGTHVGDDPSAVEENRRRVLAALGCEADMAALLVPNQVHGDHVVLVTHGDEDELCSVRAEIAEGADAIVCVAPHVPVMLCYADCVPVVLTAPGGFAVVHSGWKGTFARISAKAARVLAEVAQCPLSAISAYIGPHIQGDEYEVSEELIQRFDAAFGWHEAGKTRLLDLTRAIRQALEEVGLEPDRIEDTGLSTVKENDRFYSYRVEQGTCGRHGAVAVLMGE